MIDHGFVINNYDPCVENKVINRKKLTLVWNVDDFKLSHVDQKVVDRTIDWMKKKSGP